MVTSDYKGQVSVREQTNWVSFASDLTDVCKKHGIGIEGGIAYRMEGDDHLFSYRIDDAGNIARV